MVIILTCVFGLALAKIKLWFRRMVMGKYVKKKLEQVGESGLGRYGEDSKDVIIYSPS